MQFNTYLFIFPGSFKFLKRNQVKLHDNVLKLMQEREEERKERDDSKELTKELIEQVKLLVIFF